MIQCHFDVKAVNTLSSMIQCHFVVKAVNTLSSIIQCRFDVEAVNTFQLFSPSQYNMTCSIAVNCQHDTAPSVR
jgi:hypothetical protein